MSNKLLISLPAPVALPHGSASSSPVCWPSLRGLLRHMRTRPTNLGRVVTVGALYLRARGWRQSFEQRVDASVLFGALQRRGTEAFAPLYRALLDRRFGLRTRFEVYAHDVRTAETWWGPTVTQVLSQGLREPLLVLEGFQLDLGVNEYSMEEGLWSLTLRSAAGRRLSSASFSFLPGNRILVGSVQGPKMDDQAALAEIREATHTFHGLRPPHLVLALLKVLACHCRHRLLGIDPQVKARLRRLPWSRPYHFDYRTFWQEQGGTLAEDGYWQLPTLMPSRPLAEVPARKRAMYRRRAALLAALPAALRDRLGTAQPSGPS